MKKCISLIFILFIFLKGYSQLLPSDSIILTNPDLASDIKVDWFNQLYLINSEQNIWKLSTNLKWSNHRSQLPIQNLNVDNPFRIYYIDAISSLHILDDSLIEIEESLPLYSIGTINPKIFVMQTKNRFWTLDILKEQLFLYDVQLNQRIHTSDRIKTYPEEIWQRAKIINGDLTLFSNQRIIIFSSLGQIKYTIDLPESSNIDLINTNLWYTMEQDLYYKNYLNSDTCKVNLTYPIEKFSISPTKIYVLSNGVVYIYPINLLESNPCILLSPETLVPEKLH